MTRYLPVAPIPRGTPEDRAYLRWYRHTLDCDACRTGALCEARKALKAAWQRAARVPSARPAPE
ncbi:hypothetical protein STIB_73540 [Streptomyces sp. IB2014 011-1]|nr:hypothetical protein STIB_73540 [Streptomyces sp. IB2014 011-1]